MGIMVYSVLWVAWSSKGAGMARKGVWGRVAVVWVYRNSCSWIVTGVPIPEPKPLTLTPKP